jgi:hypothetical protein
VEVKPACTPPVRLVRLVDNEEPVADRLAPVPCAVILCGYQEYADLNAARNSRTCPLLTALRDGGLLSTSSKARADEATGKPLV